MDGCGDPAQNGEQGRIKSATAELRGVYLPKWIEIKRRESGWQRVETAMFPRYLFVRQSYLSQDIGPIRSTYGVMHLVRFGSEIASVSDGLIEQIRSLEASQMGTQAELKPFQKGDRVKVTEGPFAGIEAEIFSVGQQRVVLLMQIINRVQQVEFEVNNVVAV